MKEKITIEELEKWADIEIGCLRYYGHKPDLVKLTPESNIYQELRAIGYVKKQMPLHRRCGWATITADEIVSVSTKIEDMYRVYTWDRENKFTALEVLWILYPERRENFLHLLTKGQYD